MKPIDGAASPRPQNVHGRLIEAYYQPDQMVTAGPGRRLAGWFLDGLIAALTLGVGWLIWFFIVAHRGQTPGKQLLGMYILRGDGTRAGGAYTLLREVVIKYVYWLLSVLTLGLLTFVGALWCLWDRNHQCLWDKLGSTYIGAARGGFMPQTLTELDPNAKGSNRALAVVLGVIAVLAMLGVAAGFAVSQTTKDGETPTALTAANSLASGGRENSTGVETSDEEKSEPGVGDAVAVGSLDLTVTELEMPFNPTQYNMFNTANVAVHFTATNTRGDAGQEYDFILNSFKVVDASGVAHPAVTCVGCPGDFSTRSLLKGGSLEGVVYFEVPEGATLTELLYEPLFSRNKARILLR